MTVGPWILAQRWTSGPGAIRVTEDHRRELVVRIGIVGCEILKKEVEMITSDDPEVVHREYLQWGLHDYPDQLRSMVIGKVNALAGEVDVVFLGYAICKSLDSVPKDIEVPFVILREEDCIASMLGPNEYAKERAVFPGTWYSTPGWAELGMDAIVSDDQILGLEERGYTKLHFVKLQLDGYSRCLAIDAGVGDFERYHALTKELADQLELGCDSRRADLAAIKGAWRDLKEGRWRRPSGQGAGSHGERPGDDLYRLSQDSCSHEDPERHL